MTEAERREEEKRRQTAVEHEALSHGVASAYFAWVTMQSDAARQRASVAFTMVSFIVGAIVAAGLFGDVQREAVWVRLLGIGALAGWLTGAGLLLYAAVRDVRREGPEKRRAVDVADLMQTLVVDQERERNSTYERLDRAMAAVTLALVLTLAVLAAVVLDNPARHRLEGQIVLTASGVKSLPRACRSAAVPSLRASLDERALDAAFVEIDVDRTECGGRRQTVHVRRDAISGFQSR